MNITHLFEDNHIIVCVKPSGVLSQGGELDIPNMVDELKTYLRDKYNKPGNVYLGLVHRLDLNVGGVMVFAKTSKAAKRLSEQVREHLLSKKYIAITENHFKDKQGNLTNYISKNETQKQAELADINTGKKAELNYNVIDEVVYKDNIYSLVDIELITGRFHQIRFQLANINHPIYGDSKYGSRVINKDFFLGLFAYELSFTHPVTKEELTFKYKPDDSRFLMFKSIDRISWRSE